MKTSILSADSKVLIVESLLWTLLGRAPTMVETFHLYQSTHGFSRTFYYGRPGLLMSAWRYGNIVRA